MWGMTNRRVSRRWAGFPRAGPVGVWSRRGGVDDGVLGEGGADAGPGGGDRLCPAPGGVDAQPQLSGAAGNAGGDVQDAITKCFDLAARQVGVVGEADEFSPGDQIGCCHDDFEPGRVGVKSVER